MPGLCLGLLLWAPIAGAQTPLPIPPFDSGVMVDGIRTFDLLMQTGATEFFPGVDTPTAPVA